MTKDSSKVHTGVLYPVVRVRSKKSGGSGTVIWSDRDIELLSTSYKNSTAIRGRPRAFPTALLERHARSNCAKKAHRLGISGMKNEPTFTNEITVEDINYIAGFFDADGSISWGNRPVFRLANSNKDVLLWAKETVGAGWIRKKPIAKTHTMQHYSFEVARTKDLYCLLKQLLPRVIVKETNILKAINWLEDKYPFLTQAQQN